MKVSELQDIKQRYKIVGNCASLNHALDVALQVAPTDLSVLIVGESGVGKEVIPRVIHDSSPRRRGKYFAINCGSIPEGTIDSELFGHVKGSFTGAISDSPGYFGAADKGTLFLDEVGELPLATQARLLRVLETGEYIPVGATDVRKTDVRVVAATNVNMQRAISEGRFREDLYYRLNSIPIQMPPLRERGDDIPLLFRFFAMQMAEKYKMEKVVLTDGARDMLMKYKWPGNIRQLKNVTEQISILSPQRDITPEVLSEYIPQDIETTQLVSMSHKSDSDHSFEGEREILYKILFELRGHVNELTQELNELKKKLNTSTANTPAVAPTQNYLPRVAEDAVAEEYVEPTNSLNLETIEKQMLIKALERNNGNRKKAAEELGYSDRTLYRRLKQYGLEDY
ncbi:MAG: sigma-54 dependent transcriptional regulator [Prevotella sp.]|nr:sigma-54 dependent transcriptional regulator [Prevotella sp.]MCI7579276.1 sigma-54 dependent transcriptional regulator [Prevotella sp.]